MKRMALTLMAMLIVAASAKAKTLIVYYSFTNNIHTIATDLQTQIADADMVRIEPAEKGLDYAANGYAIGSALISAIRQNPADPASYPPIDPVGADIESYDDIIVATPLWWGNMAAPMQTFLFNNGRRMAGKRIGLIVSSASSGISGVEADARRLIPDGDFAARSLWIRSSQTSDCHALSAAWLEQTGLATPSGVSNATAETPARVTVSGNTLSVKGRFSRLYIHDAAGRLALTSASPATDISRLQPGVYAVRLQGAGKESATKVMINR